MKKIIILGGSGAGMIAASVVDRLYDMEMVGFLNDGIDKGGVVGDIKTFPVLGRVAEAEKFLEDEDVYFFCAYEGIRNPWQSYKAWKSLPIPKERFINLFDKYSCIPEEYVKIGQGVLAAPFVQVSPDATISDNVMLLGNCFVGHNSFIGEFSHITTNAVVGSWVHVGKGVTIGTNSVVRERVHIGDFSLIGSGAVVTKDVPPNTIVAGNPARILRERGKLDYLDIEPRNVIY